MEAICNILSSRSINNCRDDCPLLSAVDRIDQLNHPKSEEVSLLELPHSVAGVLAREICTNEGLVVGDELEHQVTYYNSLANTLTRVRITDGQAFEAKCFSGQNSEPNKGCGRILFGDVRIRGVDRLIWKLDLLDLSESIRTEHS